MLSPAPENRINKLQCGLRDPILRIPWIPWIPWKGCHGISGEAPAREGL